METEEGVILSRTAGLGGPLQASCQSHRLVSSPLTLVSSAAQLLYPLAFNRGGSNLTHPGKTVQWQFREMLKERKESEPRVKMLKEIPLVECLQGKKKVGSSNKEQKLNCVKCHQMMWKNPHVLKYASQYGLRTHFAGDVRMVSASPALQM